MIKNYMEILVDEVCDNIKTKYETCLQEECKDDIKSVALNNLEPKYFTSSSSDAEKKAFLLNRQTQITAIARLTEARETICNNCKKNEGKL